MRRFVVILIVALFTFSLQVGIASQTIVPKGPNTIKYSEMDMVEEHIIPETAWSDGYMGVSELDM